LVHIAVFEVGLRLRACTLSIFTSPIWKVFGPNYKVCNWRSTEAVVNHSGIQLQASASVETFCLNLRSFLQTLAKEWTEKVQTRKKSKPTMIPFKSNS
jgi:hypothetical protein